MRTIQLTLVRAALCLATLGCIFIASSRQANAQIFQYLYGNSTCFDRGFGGVQPLAAGGYISVGITSGSSGCGTSDIYVVKTNNTGGLIWSRAINIGVNDTATDVRECANGDYIITGTTDTNMNCQRRRDAFLIRLASNGTIVWAKTYGTAGYHEGAFSVLETTTSAGGTTSAGDFVVAGWRQAPVNSTGGTLTEGYLFRTDKNGGQLWDASYDVPFGTLRKYTAFFSVDEAKYDQDGHGLGRGDIIAGGMAQQIGGPTGVFADAFIVRVNGSSGAFSGTTHGALIWNCDSNEIGRCVRELQVGSEAGRIVLVGTRYSASNAPLEIFALKTGPNPSGGLLAEHLYHASQCIGDEALWVREIQSSNAGLTTGNLIIAGTDYTTANNAAFLMEIVPGTLAWAPGPTNLGFKRYMAYSYSNGYSVAEVPSSLPNRSPGFILSGASDDGNGDPGQLYLVKTNATGVSCWSFDITSIWDLAPTRAGTAVSPNVSAVGSACGAPNQLRSLTYQNQLCLATIPMCPICKQSTGTNLEEGELSDGSSGEMLGAYPNPIQRGGTVQLEYRLEHPSTVLVSVTNTAGDLIVSDRRTLPAGMALLPFSTEKWPAGAYMITLKNGRQVMTKEVVVVE